MFRKYSAQIGDRVRVTLRTGETYDMTISQKTDPLAAGLADYRGPQIVAHIRPGGFSVNLDSSQAESVESIA